MGKAISITLYSLKLFNGRLVLTNLKENKKTLVSYLNGKPYLPSNKNSIHTNTIKPSAWEEQNCRYYVTCTWVTEENPNCSPTYYSNTDGDDFCYEPDNTVGGCYYYWDLVSSVIDRQCDQVWVPDPPDNTGGGGQGGDSPPSNEQVVHTDSLAAHFPCAVKLILDKLAENGVYADFVQPFTTSQRPDLTWTNANLNWVPNGDSGNIKLGSTEVDKALNTVNRSASITLNTSMLQNSSQLMIAATAIHETLHAYINYQIITGGPTFTTPPDYDPNKPWLYSVDAYAYMFGLPSNFRDHWAMLDEYFDRSVQILKQFDNSAHLDNDYVMAMLYGLNNADGFLSMQGSLNDEYKKIMSRYKISQSQLDAFWNTQLYATSNKLPNDCP
ncbi:hypothetical protein [Mucilaginibacter sp. 44-25]|uniref:hypothetical protein n=1 Tax=Mucilaginibacter sp. 44-25 TaxID=1895794 RepID=UPI0025D634A0|nr:hypothetical protein [Mucilaginibacter sp. 44-25]